LTAFNYSLLWREAAISLLPEAYRRDMGVIVGTPLQQGALAERFDELLESSAWLSPPRREQYRRLYALLDEVGMPIHEAALRWVLSDARVGTVIVGARSVREVEANVAAVEAGPLEEELLTRLDEIAELVPFRPFEEPGGAFGLPFGRQYRGPGALFGTGAAGGITGQEA
jgi:aryl-alcohol dehydrogenase-like predicted oxidoreductase